MSTDPDGNPGTPDPQIALNIRFPGQYYDAESGLHYNRHRYYLAEIGRYISADPVGQAGGINVFGYGLSNPLLFFDPLGLSGMLTIHSSGNGGSSMTSGHSWIAYTPDGGTTTTYGTWGNNPSGLGNGLHQNLEAGRTGDASRSMHIDDAAEAALMGVIADYTAQGADAWQLDSPCSSFARQAWQAGTLENLNSNWGPISNPTTLKNSIINANGGAAHATTTTTNGASSASSGSIGRSSGSSSIRPSGSSLLP